MVETMKIASQQEADKYCRDRKKSFLQPTHSIVGLLWHQAIQS